MWKIGRSWEDQEKIGRSRVKLDTKIEGAVWKIGKIGRSSEDRKIVGRSEDCGKIRRKKEGLWEDLDDVG